MKPSIWIWSFKYRNELKTLDQLTVDDDNPGGHGTYLQMLRTCPDPTHLGNSQKTQQRWFALASIFSHNCTKQEHSDFWAIADQHTQALFWRPYLDVKIRDLNQPHHRKPSISYHDKVWWQRWPSSMLASIAHADHIYNGKSHAKRPLILHSLPIMERELVLSLNFGDEWQTFKESVFRAFLNLDISTSYTHYDEKNPLEFTPHSNTVFLDYDASAHFIKNMYDTYHYTDSNIIEHCLHDLYLAKPPERNYRDAFIQSIMDYTTDLQRFNQKCKQAVVALEYFPEQNERIDFALNFLQARSTNVFAYTQGYYTMHGRLPSKDVLESAFPNHPVESALATADLIVDPSRNWVSNFETAYSTYQIQARQIQGCSIPDNTRIDL